MADADTYTCNIISNEDGRTIIKTLSATTYSDLIRRVYRTAAADDSLWGEEYRIYEDRALLSRGRLISV